MLKTASPAVTPALGGRAGPRETRFLARARVGRTFTAWRNRHRQRAALAQLDARLLRDIGLTRADVVAECAKPFWKG
jgi:uncharacterized protein YjiS (DUF1127 family)